MKNRSESATSFLEKLSKVAFFRCFHRETLEKLLKAGKKDPKQPGEARGVPRACSST